MVWASARAKCLKDNTKNSEILDYGCGIGSSIEKTIKYSPKKIIGIDISEISINKAKKKAEELKINVDYRVDNCEKTNFENNTFDIVYGTGILHHLQTDKCLIEINRILKKRISFVSHQFVKSFSKYFDTRLSIWNLSCTRSTTALLLRAVKFWENLWLFFQLCFTFILSK